MDWALAIARKRRELAVLRLLRPAEAALRRLIFILAIRLRPQVTNGLARALPDFLALGADVRAKRRAFCLIDPRKRFAWLAQGSATNSGPMPRIRVFGSSGFGVIETSTHAAHAADYGKRDINTVQLQARIAAFQTALNTLPHQARRMARLIERRKGARPGPRSVGPLRPGLPPGLSLADAHKARQRAPAPGDIATILLDCHGLARDVEALPP